MTADELAQEAIKGILGDSGGDSQLRTFARPELWVTSSLPGEVFDKVFRDKTLITQTADLLIDWGALKPDRRQHRGVGKLEGEYYRLSRGWWNKNHPTT